ncbi:MAG: twin-arginine translocase TatA/TatE family subunit [Lentisphaeria bacterium]|nr:twin-arginine translocase TatA/TatE family subunit [Lentisphaeria bacterium]
MGLSMTEILVIFLVILLLFGAKKIPEIARSLGKASFEFKKAKEELLKETEELKDAAEEKALADSKKEEAEELAKLASEGKKEGENDPSAEKKS